MSALSTQLLTKSNLKKFNAFVQSQNLDSKKHAPSEVSFHSNASRNSRGGKGPGKRHQSIKRAPLTVVRHLRDVIIPKLAPVLTQLSSKKRLMSAYKEGYLTDSKDVKTDPKSLQNEIDMLTRELQLIKDTFRGLAGKFHELHIDLTDYQSGTSGAATAQSPVFLCIPSNSAEFASIAVLFDEFICDGTTAHWDVNVTNSNTAEIHAAIAFDPTNAGAYANVKTVIEASQYDGPVHLQNCTRTATPFAITRSGMWKKKFVCPKGPNDPNPNANSADGVGNWTSTNTTGTIYGQIKGYVEQASAGLTTSLVCFMHYHCRFRSRS